MAEHEIPAGWYSMEGDPPNMQRYWDGLQWTNHQHVVAASPSHGDFRPEPPAPQSPEIQYAAPVTSAIGTAASFESGLPYEGVGDNWDQLAPTPPPPQSGNTMSTWDQVPLPPAPPADGAGSEPSPLEWALLPFRQYATFKGRACRAEFWWHALLHAAVYIPFNIFMAAAMPTEQEIVEGAQFPIAALLILGIFGIFWVASLLPSCALSVRRLHDTGRSGWLLLLALIPFLGPLILLGFYLTPSQSGWNKHGQRHVKPVA